MIRRAAEQTMENDSRHRFDETRKRATSEGDPSTEGIALTLTQRTSASISYRHRNPGYFSLGQTVRQGVASDEHANHPDRR
jgi:hypothetical protein